MGAGFDTRAFKYYHQGHLNAQQVRYLECYGIALFRHKIFCPRALFIAELDDIPSPKIVPGEEIQVILIIPGFPIQQRCQEKAACDLEMQACGIGHPIKNHLSGPIDRLLDPIAAKGPF